MRVPTRTHSRTHRRRHCDSSTALSPAQPRLSPPGAEISGLLQRYVHAWETADARELASLLRQDAALTLPPLPSWYSGCAAIRLFFETHLYTGPEARGLFRLRTTRANGCPAMAVYQRGSDGVFRPASLQVLTLEGDHLSRIDCFLVSDGRAFARFNLPPNI